MFYPCVSAPYYLIYWLEEDSVSVVTSGSIVGGDFNTLDIGTECKVKQRSKFFFLERLLPQVRLGCMCIEYQ